MEEQAVQTVKKRRKLPGWAKIVLAVALTLAVSLGGLCLALGRNGLSMVETYLLARFAFVETGADLDAATDQGLNAFVNGLGDRWSYYLTEQQYRQVMTSRANNYVGVGITVLTEEREEGLLVQSVVKDGPADRAGIVAGDVITAVDGTSVAGEDRKKGVELIAGQEGARVVLTLLRADGSTRDAVCVRATLHNPTASGRMLEGDIGYVYLANFNSGAADSFIQEVDSLVSQGAKGLVIDVRDDGGGYVDELTEILDYLLPEGPIFTMRPRWGFETISQSDEDCVDLPIVVMVNANTYSAAELLAGQLRESAGAPVVGARTSGKGYAQVTFPLSNGGGVGLSTSAYCTGGGHSLIGEGLIPDVALDLDAGAVLGGENDNQLAAALDLFDGSQIRIERRN